MGIIPVNTARGGLRAGNTDTVRENAVQGNNSQEVPAPQADSVTISAEARLLAEARRAARESGDLRQEKVQELKAQINKGTYKINDQKILSRLLREDKQLFDE